jgi:hypothetical protein
MGIPAPDAVKRLVDRFDQDRRVFVSGGYKEEHLHAHSLAARRSAFVVRTYLGPVIHEESIKASLTAVGVEAILILQT